MKKVFKIILWSVLGLIIFIVGFGSIFIYKIKNGFPVSYETEIPVIEFPKDKKAILLFTKSTGFRHSESIEASKVAIAALGDKNNWFVYETASSAVFNPEQLKKFQLVIFSNCTGRLLNDEQQSNLQHFVETGGAFLGIHGAGDFSHHWKWYESELIGAAFSHHALKPNLQTTEVFLHAGADSGYLSTLPANWSMEDEWYVFYQQPINAQVVLNIDGTTINPDGNILFIKDKNFGMGKDHPVAWYRRVKNGKSFYTSMGHSAEVWQNPSFVSYIKTTIMTSVNK